MTFVKISELERLRQQGPLPHGPVSVPDVDGNKCVMRLEKKLLFTPGFNAPERSGITLARATFNRGARAVERAQNLLVPGVNHGRPLTGVETVQVRS